MSDSIKRLKVLNAENQRVIRVSTGVLRAAITEINAHVALNGPGIMTAMVLNGLKGAIGEPIAVGGEAGKQTSLREGIAAIRGSGVKIDQQKIMAERGESSTTTAVPENQNTPHFDTIALDTARDIMCDVERRHEFVGGDIQLLSRIQCRIQCRIDEACRAAMLNGGKS